MPGDRFGDLERLGGGAAGDVYRAFDRRSGREVAVKTLHHLDAVHLYRLHTPLQGLRSLFHENVAPVFDAVTVGPMPFLVREAVDGEPFLDTWLRALSAGDTATAADLLAQLLEGLDALHRQGLAHGHLAASNIRFDEGRVVLLDGGLRSGSRRHDLSQALRLLGTATEGAGEGSEPWRQLLQLEGDQDALDREIRRHLATLQSQRAASPPVLDRPFNGRERELANLDQALASTRSGRAVVTFIEGEPGIGTSALMARFHRRAAERHAEAFVLSACCRRATSRLEALGGLIADLVDRLALLRPQEVEVLLPGKPRELARCFPSLLRLPSVAHSPRPAEGRAAEKDLRAERALRQLFERIAERRPLVLMLDDVQRADAESLDMLSQVLQPPDPPPLLLVLGVGAGGAENPALDRLLRSQQVMTSSVVSQRLALAPMSESDSLRMARILLGDAAGRGRARAIAAAAEGRPAWIVRLVDDLLDSLKASDAATPPIDRGAWLRRCLARLPPESRRLLEGLGVAARPLPRRIAAAVANLDQDRLDAALEPLFAEDLVRPLEAADPSLCVTDSLIAGAVAEECADRSAVSRRLAEALEQTGAPGSELARVWAAAGDHDSARLAAAAGAESAISEGRFDDAIDLLRLALELAPAAATEWAISEGPSAHAIDLLRLALELAPAAATDRWRLHRDLARALDLIGDYQGAAASYLAASLTAPAGGATLLCLAADRHLVSGDKEKGLEMLRPLLERTGLTPFIATPNPVAGMLRRLLIRARLAVPPLPRRRPVADGDEDDKLLAVDVCWTLCRGLRTVDPGYANDLSGEHLVRARRYGEPYRLARALALETAYQAYGGWRRRQRVERLSRRATSLSRQLGQPRALGLAEVMTGEAWALLGEWRRALAALDRGLVILETECPEAWWERRCAMFLQLRCLAMMGRLSEIGHLLNDSRSCSPIHRATFLRRAVESRFGWLVELAEDRPGKALEVLERHRGSASDPPQPAYWHLFGQVEVAIYSGGVYGAWHLLEEHWASVVLPRLANIEFLRIEAWHWRCRAALAALVQRPEGADAPGLILAVEQAIDVLEGIDSPWAEAVTWLVRAGLDSLRGRRYEALESLQKAETRLDHLDMALCMQAARRQRARLMPSAVAEDRVADADRLLVELGAASPRRIADLLVPGGWDDRDPTTPTRPL